MTEPIKMENWRVRLILMTDKKILEFMDLFTRTLCRIAIITREHFHQII